MIPRPRLRDENTIFAVLLGILVVGLLVAKRFVPQELQDLFGLVFLGMYFMGIGLWHLYAKYRAAENLVIKSFIRGGERDYEAEIWLRELPKPEVMEDEKRGDEDNEDNLVCRYLVEPVTPVEVGDEEYDLIEIISPAPLEDVLHFQHGEVMYMGLSIEHPNVAYAVFDIAGDVREGPERKLVLTLREASKMGVPALDIHEVLKDAEIERLRREKLRVELDQKDLEDHVKALLNQIDYEKSYEIERINAIIKRHGGIVGLMSTGWGRPSTKLKIGTILMILAIIAILYMVLDKLGVV